MQRKRSFHRAQAGFSLIELLIVVAIISILATVAVPKLLKSLETGRESAAIQTLRTIHNTQASFQAAKQRFGSLKELSETGQLDANYANGLPVSGYIYTSGAEVSQDSYCVQATRQAASTASRDFNVIEDGTIRYVESKTPSPIPHGEGAPLASGGASSSGASSGGASSGENPSGGSGAQPSNP